MREVVEAVRQDQAAEFARKYGFLIGVLVILALAGFGGYLYWRSHQQETLEKQSEQIVTAIEQANAGNNDKALADLQGLGKGSGPGAQSLADLLRAGIRLEQSKPQEAVKLYDQVASDKNAPPPLRDIATIRAVTVQFDKLDPQKVIDRLSPMARVGNPWFGTAGELVAMAYLKQGKPKSAGPLLVSIAKDKDVPESIRSRTRQLAGTIGYDAITNVDKALAQMQTGPQGAGNAGE